MKTVLTQAELSERWGVTIKTITEWRGSGVIQTIRGIPKPMFSLEYIQNMEGVTIEKFSPLERKRMEMELEKLKHQNEELKKILGNVLSESSKIIGF
ncbi:histidine kinase [Clostridium gasigenes]|uniref:Uncharacterized protein n=1 Tax=Clostridium gasigenes TaxID=94869 RepID=A0A1H0M540_9CLOT|nr:histidine kinase [Clostridium gasigenes]SDO75612.1 hypothetical protein SAMN04488529_101327 [Clostridium gasigenes]